MSEFDYEWQNLSVEYMEPTPKRITDFLKLVAIPPKFFNGKLCLDAGCGSGRFTYAMQQLGAQVDSFDISEEGVKKCREVNPNAYVFDLMKLQPSAKYAFVICWGVLHHLPNPREGFRKVASQVKLGGMLHVMIYHKDTLPIYEADRKIWNTLTEQEKLALCEKRAREHNNDVLGWWDALNPEFNDGYTPEEVTSWFQQEGFGDIKMTRERNIDTNGVKK